MSDSRFGIRFRISLVLLLATLNSVSMAAAAIVMFGAVADRPPEADIEAVSRARTAVDTVHDAALTADAADAEQVEALLAGVARAQAAVQTLQQPPAGLSTDLSTYERRLRAWLTTRQRLPDGDPGLEEPLADLKLAHHHLSGSMQLAVSAPRPPWVEAAFPLLPWAMAWVLLFGVVTLAVAWSLRSALSKPLADLAAAASAVADGELEVELPAIEDPPEISILALAMQRAQQNLVSALRDVEARSARETAILTHMNDGVLLLDAQGRVVQQNPRAEALLWQLLPTGAEPRTGVRSGELIAELDGDVLDRALLHPGRATEVEAHRSRAGASERRADDPEAGHTFVAITVRPVPTGTAGDSEAGFVVVLRDVTAERTVEQLQREFLSVVTHELKTPLTAIGGYARLLLSGKGGELPPRAESFVQTIHDQSGVLRAMVQNLLDTSRIEDGTLPVHLRPVDLHEALSSLHRTWEGGAQSAGLTLAADLDAARSVVVRADPGRLDQIVGNLVGNAIEHTPEGGTVTLRGCVDRGQARIDVSDTGSGIPPHEAARIFEKFFQAERGDTRVASGAGLGLFICRQLAEAMGGTTTVRSTLGQGSTFSVRLPLADPDTDTDTDADADADSSSPSAEANP